MRLNKPWFMGVANLLGSGLQRTCHKKDGAFLPAMRERFTFWPLSNFSGNLPDIWKKEVIYPS
jgi:hypothetical protein